MKTTEQQQEQAVTKITNDSGGITLDKHTTTTICKFAYTCQEYDRTEREIKIARNKLKQLEEDLLTYADQLTDLQAEVLVAIEKNVKEQA